MFFKNGEIDGEIDRYMMASGGIGEKLMSYWWWSIHGRQADNQSDFSEWSVLMIIMMMVLITRD